MFISGEINFIYMNIDKKGRAVKFALFVYKTEQIVRNRTLLYF